MNNNYVAFNVGVVMLTCLNEIICHTLLCLHDRNKPNHMATEFVMIYNIKVIGPNGIRVVPCSAEILSYMIAGLQKSYGEESIISITIKKVV